MLKDKCDNLMVSFLSNPQFVEKDIGGTLKKSPDSSARIGMNELIRLYIQNKPKSEVFYILTNYSKLSIKELYIYAEI